MPDVSSHKVDARTPESAHPSDTNHVDSPRLKKDSKDGNDAVCFTPGFPGATFGAGTIHAYLAADRNPPKVVAGISLGTLSAAVMQRCYKDLDEAKTASSANNEI